MAPLQLVAVVIQPLLFLYGLMADLRIKGTQPLSSPLTNFLSYGGKFYVGGANRIYVLDEELNVIQTTSTCVLSSDACNRKRNINKILLAHHNENGGGLIVCGTGNIGICEIRNLKNIEIVIEKSSDFASDVNYLQVSSNTYRPAVGMISQDGNFIIGVTFGEGINSYETYYEMNNFIVSYRYPISTRSLQGFWPVHSNFITKVLRLRISNVTLEDYLIYYKTCFQHNWISYFITNQKIEVGSSNEVSKIVRICQNDTGYSSYADIVLICRHNNINYNLIQDAILVDSGKYKEGSYKVFIGAFTHGNDPENPSGDTVICVTKLSTLEDAILKAVRQNALCRSPEKSRSRYLPVTNYNGCIKNERVMKNNLS